jgi:uncharacterized protein
VRLPDVNVLLNAKNSRATHHDRATEWLDSALSGGEVGFAWTVLLGFVRLATHSRVFERPLTAAAALDAVDAWLGAPGARPVAPTPQHPVVLRRLLERAGTAGNLTTDAHLAALAIEHGAALGSFDADFHRFLAHGLKLDYLG